jgi:hypothetical protein
VFIDEGTRAMVRLRTGESHHGWILSSVKDRKAVLQKEGETVLLALPVPKDTSASPGVPAVASVRGVSSLAPASPPTAGTAPASTAGTAPAPTSPNAGGTIAAPGGGTITPVIGAKPIPVMAPRPRP